MRVKIGNMWFEATATTPIAVEFTPQDRKNIRAMPKDATRYAVFHDDDAGTPAQRKEWVCRK